MPLTDASAHHSPPDNFSPSDVRDRLSYMRFTDEEFESLQRLHELTDDYVDDIVGAFYEHLKGFPAAGQFINNEIVQNKLLGALRHYLLSLGTNANETTYIEERHRIGVAHER